LNSVRQNAEAKFVTPTLNNLIQFSLRNLRQTVPKVTKEQYELALCRMRAIKAVPRSSILQNTRKHSPDPAPYKALNTLKGAPRHQIAICFVANASVVRNAFDWLWLSSRFAGIISGAYPHAR